MLLRTCNKMYPSSPQLWTHETFSTCSWLRGTLEGTICSLDFWPEQERRERKDNNWRRPRGSCEIQPSLSPSHFRALTHPFATLNPCQAEYTVKPVLSFWAKLQVNALLSDIWNLRLRYHLIKLTEKVELLCSFQCLGVPPNFLIRNNNV